MRSSFGSFSVSSTEESSGLEDEEVQISDSRFSVEFSRVPVATYIGSIFTLTNTIIGGGLLALPYGFSHTGILLGYFILFSITLLSSLSAVFLIRTVNKSTNQMWEIMPSYRDLAIQCWGRLGAIFVDITFIVLLIGALTGYLIIISETIAEYFLLSYTGYALTSLFITIFGIIPLSMIHKLHYLRFTSAIALLCDSYFLIIIFYNFYTTVINNPNWNADDINIYINSSIYSIFLGFPIIAFAYTFQTVVLPIYEELKNRSERKMISIVYISIGISTFFYIFVGTFGYLTYGENIDGNIMNNITEGTVWIQSSKLVYSIGLLFSIPVINFVQLLSLDNLLFRSIYGFAEKRIWFEPVKNFNPNPKSNQVEGRGICCVKLGQILPDRSFRRRFFLVVLTAFTMVVFSIALPKIQFVFGMVGATSGSLTVFIFPALFVLYLDPNPKMRLLSIFVVIFGVITGIVCFVSWILELFFFLC